MMATDRRARSAEPRLKSAHGTKLRVGATADAFEQEADRIADRVMRAPEIVQRACTACQEDESAACGECGPNQKHAKRENEDDEIKGKFTGDPAPIGPELEGRIRSIGAGEPLPQTERSFFEPRFGHDFARVRVHADAEAASTARALGARAFALGRDVVFAPGHYAPGTNAGRRLIAHELAHVVQQQTGAESAIRRDLATPEPTPAPAAQTDLTPAQIATALAFNKLRYDAVSTKEIQDLVGTKPTGVWIEDDIIAIAAIQERYGLKKDGMVGPNTFRFLDKELSAEKVNTKDEHCLVSFAVLGNPVVVSPVVAGSRSIRSKFTMSALLPKHCNCADYQYRQFIQGHWRRERGGVTTDLGSTFTQFPGGGGLPAAFTEDGNTAAAALNYGHRDQTAEDINHYLDDAGTVDQANGCRYEGEDNPGGPDDVVSGDVFDIRLDFRGEIQRKGRVVTSKQWTPINGRFPVP